MAGQPTTPTPDPSIPIEADPKVVMAEEQHQMKLAQQVVEYLNGWKRAQADYQNLKRSSEKEKQEIAQFAQWQTITALLPIYDNLKRAIKHIPLDHQKTDWVVGLVHTKRLFDDTLKKLGVEPVATHGQMFDPKLHHAVSKQSAGNLPSGMIVEETQTGWRSGDTVLLPAQVVVAA